MKSHVALCCALALLGAASYADASILYGATSAGGAGELWVIDATNGVGLQDVGPLNDAGGSNYAVTGMAYNPSNGILYGSTGGKTGTLLLTINPATARVTVVGSFNAGSGNTMTDLAFDAAGHLYGVGSSAQAALYSIDPGTGQGTKIGTSGLTFTAGGGLAISPSGVVFGTPITNDFGTYDPSTGAFTNITNPVKPAGPTASYGSLAFDGNTLYGMDLGVPTHLVIFDTAGNVTDLGPSVASIDAIAFVPEPATAGMVVGACSMALAFNGRRRNRGN